MTLILVTPASSYPVSLDEAKAQCFATGTSDFDGQLGQFIAGACDAAEKYLGVALTEQTWTLLLDAWADEIELPFGPITGTPAIKYFDTSNTEQTLSSSLYQVDAYRAPPRIVPAYGETWPDTYTRLNAISVTFTTAPAAIPASVKQAILMMVGFWFSNREAINVGNIVNEVPMAWKHLLDPYSRVVI